MELNLRDIGPKRFADLFLDQDQHLLVLKISLILIFAFTRSLYLLNIPVQILALYMIIGPKLVTSKECWWGLFLSVLTITLLEWDFIDNHKYLKLYWVLTCLISLYYKNPIKLIKDNARLILGIIFLIAVFHKISWGQYLNGSFFHYTYLTDGRFEFPIGYLANLTIEKLPNNYSMMNKLQDFPELISSISLFSSSKIKQISLLTSWWVVIIEFLVGITFIFSNKINIFYKLKDILLVIFILSTYSIVMVSGFYYILVLLGFSQVEKHEKNRAYLYMVCLLLYELRRLPIIPWIKILL